MLAFVRLVFRAPLPNFTRAFTGWHVKQSTLKLYFFDDCVPYRSETTRWVFHVSAFPIKPRQKRRLGESFASLSEDSASSATAEGRAKMQRQAISLGVVAPVVLARRRVALASCGSTSHSQPGAPAPAPPSRSPPARARPAAPPPAARSKPPQSNQFGPSFCPDPDTWL